MSIPLGVVTLAEHFGGRDVTHGILRADAREVAQYVAPFAAEHDADSARHAYARHIRHGDDACRGPSQSAALRSPADRRHLDERFRRHRRHPSACAT